MTADKDDPRPVMDPGFDWDNPPEPRKSWLQRSLIDDPCIKDAFLYAVCGTTLGWCGFYVFNSNPVSAMRFAFIAYNGILFSYLVPCKYKLYAQQRELKMVKRALKNRQKADPTDQPKT